MFLSLSCCSNLDLALQGQSLAGRDARRDAHRVLLFLETMPRAKPFLELVVVKLGLESLLSSALSKVFLIKCDDCNRLSGVF